MGLFDIFKRKDDKQENKKENREEKNNLQDIDKIRKQLDMADGMFLIDVSGLSVPQLGTLTEFLQSNGITYFQKPDSVTKPALQNSAFADAADVFKTGYVMGLVKDSFYIRQLAAAVLKYGYANIEVPYVKMDGKTLDFFEIFEQKKAAYETVLEQEDAKGYYPVVWPMAEYLITARDVERSTAAKVFRAHTTLSLAEVLEILDCGSPVQLPIYSLDECCKLKKALGEVGVLLRLYYNGQDTEVSMVADVDPLLLEAAPESDQKNHSIYRIYASQYCDKVKGIKLLREITGMDLKMTKEVIESEGVFDVDQVVTPEIVEKFRACGYELRPVENG